MPGNDDTVDAAGHTVDASGHTVPSSQPAPHLVGREGDLPRQIGRYRILREIGRGGMGTVYAAHDPELGRDVALKSLHELARSHAHMADRLRREAQALARVVDANVVAVHDAGVDRGTPFLVMQLIDGVTLDEHLGAHPEAGVDEIVELFAQAGRGLCAIHDAKLVHRDVKPANMLVDRDGVVRVSDLGLARIGALGDSQSTDGRGEHGALASGTDVTSGTITRGVAGTPAYMAPEQFADGEVTAAADQFSFCVALWEALFGARPFAGGTTDELLAGIKAGRVREPARDRRVPAALIRAVRRGLSPRPDDRFPTMAALLTELRPRRRKLWLAAGAVAAIGIGVGALALVGDGGATKRARVTTAPIDAAETPLAQFDISRAKRVTFNDACEEFPTFTPDGKTVYFDGQVGGSYHLFAADTATWTVTEVTQTDGWDFAPNVSPDGKRIAWVRREEGGQGMWVADLGDLGTARKLAPGPARPAWSPDGQYLWTGNKVQLARRHVVTGEVSRTIAPPDDHRPLMALEHPDGRVVLLIASPASAGFADLVLLYPADGGPPKELWRNLTSLEEVLVLAPEGDAVIVAPLDPDRATTLLRLPLDGSAPIRLREGGVPARKQLAIAHGRAIWSDCAEQTSLAKATDAGGKAVFDVMARNTWADASPHAVAGTSRIVFLSDRSEGVRLWEQDLARPGPVRRIPFGDLEPVTFSVSHDGTMIAASEGSQGLFVAPTDGSKPPLRLVPDAGDLASAFSRDGKEIFFERAFEKMWRIAAVPVTGGEPRWVAPGPSTSPATSPADDVLAYIVPGETAHEVRILDLRTKQERVVPGTSGGLWNTVTWSPDGKRLVLVRNDAFVAEIDATTGKERRRIDAGSGMLLGATMVGDDIIVGQTRWAGDLWVTDVVAR